ncbi:MAG: RIP metalloprotease RseP [Acidobacteriota bacterium]|nr:RIP metalloprotease RseP [Acidobacteriota bacterium]
MLTLLAFAFVLGVLVFVHEFGHFIMARRIGIRVITFSLGFGPKILKTQRGDTEYCISAIPLGGYVKMAGDNPEESRSGAPDEFLSRTKWERFQVLVMGPAMNVILAIVLLAIVLMNGATVPAFQDAAPVVGAVAAGSPAQQAGIQAGDRILSVDGRAVPTWDDFYTAVGTHTDRRIPIVLERRGQQLTRDVTPQGKTEFRIGEIGVLPDVHPTIKSVLAGQPAEKAGLKAGDVVVAVDGQTVTFASQLSQTISGHGGQPVTLTIERNQVQQQIQVTPQLQGKTALIGVTIGDAVKTFKPGVLEAIGLSFQRNYQYSILIGQTVWGLITRQISAKQLMGPVAIAQLSGESAQAGWIALFGLMASISLNLGLLNLLPIPVLDGGHIFIMALEGIARRDFSVQVKEKVLLAGFAFLMLLMVMVIYNDLTRIPWIDRFLPFK